MDVLSEIRTIQDEQLFEIEDCFLGGLVSGSIGSVGWTETVTGAGTNLLVAGGVNHPGVFRVVTGGLSGNNKALHLGVAVTDPIFTPTLVERFRWVVRIPTITSIVVRLGLMQSVSGANGGTAGAYFEYDPTQSTNWRMITRQASTSTANNAVTVVAGSWYLLEAKRIATGNWEFWINGTLRFTNSTNLPTTDCNFGTLTQAASASARILEHDHCYLRAFLGQLFT
jgi:hypothetical protein